MKQCWLTPFLLFILWQKKGKRNDAAMGNGWLIGMAESSDYREWTAEGETSLDGELCCMPLSTARGPLTIFGHSMEFATETEGRALIYDVSRFQRCNFY